MPHVFNAAVSSGEPHNSSDDDQSVTETVQIEAVQTVTVKVAAAAATFTIALLDVTVKTRGQATPVLPKWLGAVHSIWIFIFLHVQRLRGMRALCTVSSPACRPSDDCRWAQLNWRNLQVQVGMSQ